MNNLERAKVTLLSGGFTCVLCNGDSIFTSSLRGVRPLVDWAMDKTDFSGFSAADKVVGKGAAFLYVKLGITAVFAEVLSRPALEILEKYGIKAEYNRLADNIINRRGDGICPFEEAVLDISDADQAYIAILEKICTS